MTLQQNILKVLAYFDIFHYPLLPGEIAAYLETPAGLSEIAVELGVLEQQNLVFRIDIFYALKDDIFLAIRRRNGNRLALPEMEKAKKAAALLYKFPFVKGLAISGSLSKNFADENTDIDFFIITQRNRLWIARTLMHVFYKWAVVRGRGRLFCMNYYVDETAMEIPEKNIFTAMEIVTLIPVKGIGCVNDFMNTNKWTKGYFPAAGNDVPNTTECREGLLKKITEKILAGRFGNVIDSWLLKITRKHWQQRKQQVKVNTKGISTCMLADKHYAKPNPENFQQKIILQYECKIKELNIRQRGTTLSPVIQFSSAVK